MSLERMFGLIEGLRETATADAVFGEAQEVQGRILIPVAAVGTGFGLGFGHGLDEEAAREVQDEPPVEEDSRADWSGEGGGAGGGSGSRPVAVVEVTAEDTVIRPIVDEGKIALAGIALLAWIAFWLSATVRAVFAED